MTDEPYEPPEGFGAEFQKFFEDLRKSASIKAGAAMFGEAQTTYYDTLKAHMTDEEAYNMLAHTTEVIIRSLAVAIGPLAEAVLKANFLWEKAGMKPTTDKEVPGKPS